MRCGCVVHYHHVVVMWNVAVRCGTVMQNVVAECGNVIHELW